MKVLQIHNRYSLPGGEDTISDAEAHLLSDAGHDVVRFRVDNPGSGAKAALQLAGAVWNPRRYGQMRAQVRDLRPDVANLHNTWFTLSPSVFDALHAERVPIVMTLQNYRLLCGNGFLFRDGQVCTDCVGSHPWHAVRHRCYRDSAAQSAVASATIAASRGRGTFDKVARFMAPSQFVKDLFVGAGWAPERIMVKPNFVADPGARDQAPSASRTVLYVGRLSPEKGIDTLLEAWRAAAEFRGDLELAIIGDGPSRAALEASAPPGVRFEGWVPADRLPARLLSSRALVFPTEWYENFGRVVVEAMAAGLPVLASDIASPAEVVGELGSEWLAAPGSVEAWAAALTRIADGGHVDSAGAKARALFEQKYTFAEGLRRLVEVYTEAIEVAHS